MLRLLEVDSQGRRLRDLLSRFRAEELSLGAVLRDLQAEADDTHQQASQRQLHDGSRMTAMLQRCTELQAECDQLATELVHVRMAIAGVTEEMDDHDSRRFGTPNLAC